MSPLRTTGVSHYSTHDTKILCCSKPERQPDMRARSPGLKRPAFTAVDVPDVIMRGLINLSLHICVAVAHPETYMLVNEFLLLHDLPISELSFLSQCCQ